MIYMSKPLTTEEFVKKARRIHGNKYDYTYTIYVNSKTCINIICPIHGAFSQKPNNHLKSSGCPMCGKEIKSNHIRGDNKSFTEKAKNIHGDKYDYSKVNYINAKTKVCIICSKHGDFWQKPNDHLSGYGCPKCANIARKEGKSTEEFTCEKYGDRTVQRELEISPSDLLSKKPLNKIKISKENFITKAKEKFGNKYIYDITDYINTKTKIKYICPIHGIIEQLPTNHLRYGCRFCSKEKTSQEQCISLEEFIKKSREIHGDTYDYSKVNYINYKTKVCIICPKHGGFWQSPGKHLCGHGCHKCKRSHLEEEMSLFLDENHIEYVEQYAPSFLKNRNGVQKIDFYLPKYNVAIECQGIQHFTNKFYIESKKKGNILERDTIKYNKCKLNNVNLLYYTNENILQLKKCVSIYTDENIFSDKSVLLEKIKIFSK